MQDRHGKRQLFYTSKVWAKTNFSQKKRVNCDKIEFATKQHKCIWQHVRVFKDTIAFFLGEEWGIASKIRLPHIYRGHKYASIKIFTSLLSKSWNFYKLTALSVTPKSAKLRQNSLLRQNSVKFSKNFHRARKKITPALLAPWNIFPSLMQDSPSYTVSISISI